MTKSEALKLLGGGAAAARAIGISTSAVSQWPDPLPPAIADRVQAAIARQHLPPELLGITPPPEPSAADLAIADRRRSERRAIDDQAAGQGA